MNGAARRGVTPAMLSDALSALARTRDRILQSKEYL